MSERGQRLYKILVWAVIAAAAVLRLRAVAARMAVFAVNLVIRVLA